MTVADIFNMAQFQDPRFWTGLGQILIIDLLLSGDNAVIIALACRSLPPKQRWWGMVLGAGVAILLRIMFAGVVTTLITLPWLKIVGGVLLFYIAIKLVQPQEHAGGGDAHNIEASDSLWRAVRTIAIADAVMSLDNVIAIAGAAHGNVLLIAIGLLITIPLIIGGSALLLAIIDRYPVVIWAGAALLGWLAGELIATDPFVHHYIEGPNAKMIEVGLGLLGAAAVVAVGWYMHRRIRVAELDRV